MPRDDYEHDPLRDIDLDRGMADLAWQLALVEQVTPPRRVDNGLARSDQ
ncbi:hypothetical protein ACFYOK_35975 [Microbispora bryophytorum]